MTVDELLPCPCCGSDELEINSWRAFWGKLAYQSRISCKCGAQMLAFGSTKEDAEAQASKKWNTRHERTCHNKSVEGERLLLCSKCGAFTKVTNATEYIVVHYCGNCGAKVVDE